MGDNSVAPGWDPIWKRPDLGWRAPNQHQVKEIGKMIGDGGFISRKLGWRDSRVWRRYTSGERKISWCTWRCLCELADIEIEDIQQGE